MTGGMTRTPGGLREPLIAFAMATALAAVLAAIGTAVPLVRDNLHGLIAIVFFYTPSVAARGRAASSTTARWGCARIRCDSTWRVVAASRPLTFPAFVGGFLPVLRLRLRAGAGERPDALVGAALPALAGFLGRPPAPAPAVRAACAQPAGGGGHSGGAVLPRLPDGAVGAGLAADAPAVRRAGRAGAGRLERAVRARPPAR